MGEQHAIMTEEVKLPDGIQAAIDAGEPDEVQRLLTPVPEGMSKALQKKLIKQADIKKKSLAKGKGPPAIQSAEIAGKPCATAVKLPATPMPVSTPSAAKAEAVATSPLLINEDEKGL